MDDLDPPITTRLPVPALTSVFISVLVSPLIVVGNVLVILPFTRSTRIRTASNQLLLLLGLCDLSVGVTVPLMAVAGAFSAVFDASYSAFSFFQST